MKFYKIGLLFIEILTEFAEVAGDPTSLPEGSVFWRKNAVQFRTFQIVQKPSVVPIWKLNTKIERFRLLKLNVDPAQVILDPAQAI